MSFLVIQYIPFTLCTLETDLVDLKQIGNKGILCTQYKK